MSVVIGMPCSLLFDALLAGSIERPAYANESEAYILPLASAIREAVFHHQTLATATKPNLNSRFTFLSRQMPTEVGPRIGPSLAACLAVEPISMSDVKRIGFRKQERAALQPSFLLPGPSRITDWSDRPHIRHAAIWPSHRRSPRRRLAPPNRATAIAALRRRRKSQSPSTVPG